MVATLAPAPGPGSAGRLETLARELATHIRAAEGADGDRGDGGADVADRMRAGLPALLDACLDVGTGERVG